MTEPELEPDFDIMSDEELARYLTPERAELPQDTPPLEPAEPTDEDVADEDLDPGESEYDDEV